MTVEATPADDDSIVGDECHIVSPKPGGPRYDPGFPETEYDEYSNLLLLCKVHHKLVDDQVATYTADRLRSMKTDHEKWVAKNLNSEKGGTQPCRVRRIPENIPKFMRRIRSGRELLSIVHGVCAYAFGHDDLQNEREMDLISGFLQNAQDWGELDLNRVGDLMQAAQSLDQDITDLERSGFWAFGCRENQILEGGAATPSEWTVAHLLLVRDSNPEIVKITTSGDESREHEVKDGGAQDDTTS